MVGGLVESCGLLPGLVQLLPAPDAGGVGGAEGQVAGGVLVKQGVVEQNARVADGGVIGHQGHLPQVGGALVHGDGVFQHLFPLFRVDVHDLPAPEVQIEVPHQVAVQGQGQGGVHPALHPVPPGGGEDLLRGHVGHELHPGGGGLAASHPHVPFRQGDGQVGAQGVGIAQGLEVVVVEDPGPAGGGLHMGPPPLHSLAVPGDAAHGEDGLPQRVDGVLPLFVREHLLRPGPGGVGADGPLEAAGAHGVEIGPGGLGAGALPVLDAHGVHPLEHLRVRADDGQGGRALGQQPVEFSLLIVGEFGKHRPVRLQIALAGDEVVRPLHQHVPGAAIQGGSHAQPGQGSAFHRGGDAGGLPGLEVHAHLHQQMGVFVELCFKIGNHGVSSPVSLGSFPVL